MSLGPQGGRAAVYRRRIDAEGGFETCEAGLPEWFADNIDTGRLVADGEMVAIGTSDGELYVSRDAGATWTLDRKGLPPATALLLSD